MKRWINRDKLTEGKHDYREEPERIHRKCVEQSTEQSEVAGPIVCFFIVDLKDYDIAEETIQYIQVSYMIEKPGIVNAEAEDKKASRK